MCSRPTIWTCDFVLTYIVIYLSIYLSFYLCQSKSRYSLRGYKEHISKQTVRWVGGSQHQKFSSRDENMSFGNYLFPHTTRFLIPYSKELWKKDFGAYTKIFFDKKYSRPEMFPRTIKFYRKKNPRQLIYKLCIWRQQVRGSARGARQI